MDILRGMKLFARVVELKSFSAAAVELGVAHSTISKSISGLESSLDTQLICRTTRQFRLTESGLEFYKYCVEIVSAVDTAWCSMNEKSSQLTGRVHVGLPISFVRHVGEIIVNIRKELPELKIELSPDEDGVSDLVKNGYDVTIRVGELENSTCVAQRLFTSNMMLCASPCYVEKFGWPKSLKDLKNHNCLTYRSGEYASCWSFKDRKSGECVVQPVSGTFSADTCEILTQVALLGEGMIYIPSFAVSEYIKGGRLISFPLIDLSSVQFPVYAVYPPGKSRPEKLRLFVEVLKSVLSKFDDGELPLAGVCPSLSVV